jgi:hypothetical protein
MKIMEGIIILVLGYVFMRELMIKKKVENFGLN